ncbi:MAG: methylase [Methanohalophilus sp.]|nr:MAG: methylase [Methanohalophilus sp.]
MLSILYRIMRSYGIDPLKTYHAIKNTPRFLKTYLKFKRNDSFYPILTDYDSLAGSIRGHYFHQDLWAARKIYRHQPTEHVDIGSRIDGFVAHLLTFMPVTVIDVRHLNSDVKNLKFYQSDATKLKLKSNSIESISSLHAIEHFGLGRYGDPINENACYEAMLELSRVLKINGRLYFSVPIGIERVEFNAHRIFDPSTILNYFDHLELIEFSAVDDNGLYHENADPYYFSDCNFACGLFEFTKAKL